jgi:hypothetical protein
MASLETRHGNFRVVFRVVFRFGGQKYSRSLKTSNPRTAKAALARLEDNLARVEIGQLILPENADLATFLLFDGRLEQRQAVRADALRTVREPRPLHGQTDLRDTEGSQLGRAGRRRRDTRRAPWEQPELPWSYDREPLLR